MSHSAETTPAPVSRRPGVLTLLAVAAVSGGAGAAVPWFWTDSTHSTASSQAATGHASDAADDMVFIPFGDVTVNLNEGRMNRYLRLKIALQVPKSHEASMTQKVTEQNLVLRNWLISHLSDKLLDEIRGAAGQNRLRREIRDHFNVVLCDDGFDRVLDVLFEEFNVQ